MMRFLVTVSTRSPDKLVNVKFVAGNVGNEV